MSGFRIIAIRTNETLKQTISLKKRTLKLDPYKVLNPFEIYQFYNEYSFPNNNFSVVDYTQKNNNLYSIKKGQNNIPINICAVVGNNGSGKSTLVELLYWANYNLGCAINLLRNPEDNSQKKGYKFFQLELLFEIGESEIVLFKFEESKVFKQKYKHQDSGFERIENREEINNIQQLKDFFYTIAINYSHYSLNTNEVGEWIYPLFHKNDGYQTPIVLYPYRKEGNININSENKLLVRRLQANILEEVGNSPVENTLRNLGNNKIVESFKLLPRTKEYYSQNFETQNEKETYQYLLKNLNKHFNLNLTIDEIKENYILNFLFQYIKKKLLKMASTYRPFRKYVDDNNINNPFKSLSTYLHKINRSSSHTVFKVKGAILYMKYFKQIFTNVEETKNHEIILDVEKLSNFISHLNTIEGFPINTFMMAPPSIFDVSFILKDGTPFESFSSGEKQRIHSISSIIYHLIYLNSVSKNIEADEEEYLPYKYFNIILDEIELYYHPEWQRQYINSLLQYIERISNDDLVNISGINIIIATHSPYILSDIPSSNILRLKQGDPQKSVSSIGETFGANIHNLLANEFFMENGYMGQWAKSKIEGIITKLNFLSLMNKFKELEENNIDIKKSNKGLEIETVNNNLQILTEKLLGEKTIQIDVLNKLQLEILNNKQEINEIIQIIGEPIIKNKLQEMFDDVFINEKKSEKQQFELLAQKLNAQIKYLD